VRRLPATLLMSILSTLSACKAEPQALPTEAAISELDRSAEPPLYQLLYDAPLLPSPTAETQRVRLLIWLVHMELSPSQLARLEELRGLAAERLVRIQEAEAQVAARYVADQDEIYGQIWTLLEEGATVDDDRLTGATEALRELRGGGNRERELLRVRLEGIRGILEAQRDFLRTLSPRQEQLMADALFFLRHALDPVAQPGSFRELIGTTYDPGQYAVLTRGTGEISRDPLDIGGLWSDEPMLEGHNLHGARREVLLYMTLQQPGLADAIAAAKPLAKARPEDDIRGLPPPPGGPAPAGAPVPDGSAPAPEGSPAPPEGAAAP